MMVSMVGLAMESVILELQSTSMSCWEYFMTSAAKAFLVVTRLTVQCGHVGTAVCHVLVM